MASIKFFTKGIGNPKTIYVRLVHGRKFDLTKSTQLLVDPKYWNNNKGSVKHMAEFTNKLNFQNQLNGLRNHLLNAFNESYANGQIIDSGWLEHRINTFFDQDGNRDLSYLVPYGEYFIDNLSKTITNNGRIGATIATEKKYRTIVNKLKDFENYRKKRLKITDVDLKFHKDFIHFLHKVQLLSYNTTGRYLKFVKTIVRSAAEEGYKISEEINSKKFSYPKEKVLFAVLNEEEIELIFNSDLSSTPYLENARDWLVIGVWTGARVSDLLNLDTKNIIDGFLEYTAKKTGQKIILPLHRHVKTIIERHDGKFPRRISSQKFNAYIKEVCKKAGLTELVHGSKNTEIEPGVWRRQKGDFPKWELVSSHICRRSFATNHYGKLPTPVIMGITGHSTEKMFLTYIGKSSRDYALNLERYWNSIE